ncbi:capsular biosynthesis protein, partial [Staphylococcus equorum]
IVQDLRILKQMQTIKSLTDDYVVLGKSNVNVTEKRLESLNFNYKLFGKADNENSIVKKLLNRIKFGVKVIKFIRKYKPDVIHANDFDVLLITYLSRYKKGKIIYDAHEIYSKNAFVNNYKILSFIVQSVEKIIVSKIDSFITVSHAAKGYYQSAGYKKNPIVVTNAPIKLESDIVESQTSNEFEVVYQGQIVSNRGYEEFLNAGLLIKEKGIQLVIRGFGEREGYLKDVKKKNEINNVRFDPPVEMDNLVSKLSESHVGVILTKSTSINFEYTVSNKIFECIHAGLPVILSPVKEHIYLNNKYSFGIVLDEVTPENIANAIMDLFNNKEKYNILKNNAIEASQILTWQNESNKLIEIYKD